MIALFLFSLNTNIKEIIKCNKDRGHFFGINTHNSEKQAFICIKI